jgi:putative ABC transport system substrate-binding protein
LVDKRLRGTKSAKLPIQQALKFEFVLYLGTAKALGLDVPTSMLLRADAMIDLPPVWAAYCPPR